MCVFDTLRQKRPNASRGVAGRRFLRKAYVKQNRAEVPENAFVRAEKSDRTLWHAF